MLLTFSETIQFKRQRRHCFTTVYTKDGLVSSIYRISTSFTKQGSCSEGQNFLFPCWNSILSFLLQMFRLTRPPEAQIRTNLRPSVASVGLSFLGITLWNIPPHDLSGHGTEEHVAGRAEEHDVDRIQASSFPSAPAGLA